MGSAIIDAIKSGLGLIKDLATEFLNGFTALFWDPAASEGAGALSVFGQYALIMLGISITFSVVKLCMGLISSKTGC